MNTAVLSSRLSEAVVWAQSNIGSSQLSGVAILENGCGWHSRGTTSDNALNALLENRLKKVGIVRAGTDRFGRVWYRKQEVI